MGRVYAAYDPRLNRRVAIKVLFGGDDSIAGRRLVREAKTLARLSHPNIVSVHEVGTFAARPFIAMEYVEGRTLAAWLAAADRSSLTFEACADLLAQAGEGLRAAHEAGIVHRDFKPANVIVSDDGRVRVVDFGLAIGGRDEDADVVALWGDRLRQATDEAFSVGGDASLTRSRRSSGRPSMWRPSSVWASP